MIFVAWIFLGIALLYSVMILLFTAGWISLEEPPEPGHEPATKVTVIIPARNEEQHILPCLESVIAQDYPPHLLEVIVIDDGSTDNTFGVVSDLIVKTHRPVLRILRLDEGSTAKARKKEAITHAISNSSGDLILTTDADIQAGPLWIHSICSYYELFRPKMILGPVGFHHEKSLFERFQSLEFFGLMGVTGGSCAAGHPVMCNGANLAYERKAFGAVGGFSGNLGYSSGDDVFLMLKIRKEFGKRSVRFLRSRNSIVLTDPQPNLRAFIDQRLRWVSKSRGYRSLPVLAVSLITYLFNLSLLAGAGIGFFKPLFYLFLLALILLKTAMELPLVVMVSGFFRKTGILAWFPFVQLLNIFYVTLIGFFGNFLSYEWKGRKIRTGFPDSGEKIRPT